MLNMKVLDLEALETPQDTAKHIKYIMENGSDRFESRHRCKNGAIIDVEVSVNYLKDRDIIFAFVRDITERKKMMKELQQLNLTLEKRIAVELEKSRQKDKIVFEQSRQIALNNLLMNIAHQWRQPLQAVGALTQDIKDAYKFNELNDDYIETSVAQIMSQLTGLSNTIDHFRLLYDGNTEKEEIDIALVIQNSIELMRSSINFNNAAVDINIPQELKIIGSSNIFTQIVISILNNALDIFKERNVNAPFINIKAKKEYDGKTVITIADNGGGIDKEIIDNIFDPYFTTKFRFRGKGLSLYFARALLEQDMNGSLTVRNTEYGADFILEI
ncbi:PAS/PAC sensor signal transduction histidine kinase [Candidatus Magnetoovum chiemensis]|nr:PAS/PAC sensor signal transduction histidine kinase [Candidatus Magnetoovum chiemensis]